MRVLSQIPGMFLTVVLASSSALASDKATIQKLDDKYSALWSKGDAKAIAQMYKEDAMMLPPGQENMVKGHGEIEPVVAKNMEALSQLKLTAVDVKPLGTNAAREVGTFIATTKGDKPQELAGKYVVVWEKVGSDWKLGTDIWNLNK